MAEIPYVESDPQAVKSPTGRVSHYYTVTWDDIGLADTCQEYQVPPDGEVSFFVEGTWGGASLAHKGRPTTAETPQVLNSILGIPANFSANGNAIIMERYPFQAPVLTGGDGTTALKAVLMISW